MIPCLHPSPPMADYRSMRCLYCGRELALLKRLTGNGEFCSDQHKQSYHDEYNRLALSRLLQAQTKTDEGRAKAGREQPQHSPELADAPQSNGRRERGPALPVPMSHKVEPVATQAAGFLPEAMTMLEGPHPAAIAPNTPLSWFPGPVIPVFNQVQPRTIEAPVQADPPLASLLAYPMQAILSENGEGPKTVQRADAGSFASVAIVFPRRERVAIRAAFDLPLAGPVDIPGILAAEPVAPELSREDSQPFFPEVFRLLTPPPSEDSVELPAEGAELRISDEEAVLAAAPASEGEPSEIKEASVNQEPQTLPVEPDPDPDSLQRLQRGLRSKLEPEPPRRNSNGRRTELPVTAGPVVDSMALESLFSPPARRPSGVRVKVSTEPAAGGVATLQMTDAGEEAETVDRPVIVAEATAPFMQQMLPITLRIVAPAKAKLISEGRPLVAPSDPQLTTTEILPLRPRIGPGKPPSSSSPLAAPKSTGAIKVKPVKNIPEPAVAATMQEQNEKPFDPREAVLAVKRSINVPENKSASAARKADKAVSGPLQDSPAGTVTAKVTEAKASQPAPEVLNEQPKQTTAAPANSATPVPNTRTGVQTDFELHLGMPERQSAFSKLSMPVKLGMAVVLLLGLAGGGYLVFSGSGKSALSQSAPAASATSLMVGEGGWITDWAGDTTGHHKGRRISVYRPSLNLTNYEIEFQGRIENNSVGWVFRAANASNFYAVKLAATGTGYRLLKYAVVNGIEKEIGQVPVRPVNGNMFPIRVEVRGDRFTTYIGNNPVDLWVDSQLKSGGVGFLNDKGDRAEITKVGISLLPGSAN